jgi:hypothetical protein
LRLGAARFGKILVFAIRYNTSWKKREIYSSISFVSKRNCFFPTFISSPNDITPQSPS